MFPTVDITVVFEVMVSDTTNMSLQIKMWLGNASVVVEVVAPCRLHPNPAGGVSNSRYNSLQPGNNGARSRHALLNAV